MDELPKAKNRELKFFEVRTAMKKKLCGILELLNQRQNQAETVKGSVEDCIVDSKERDLSTEILQVEKEQLID